MMENKLQKRGKGKIVVVKREEERGLQREKEIAEEHGGKLVRRRGQEG